MFEGCTTTGSNKVSFRQCHNLKSTGNIENLTIQASQYAIHSVIENPYVIMVKAKAVITFARLVMHSMSLSYTLFASGNTVQTQRGYWRQYMWRSLINRNAFRQKPAALFIWNWVLISVQMAPWCFLQHQMWIILASNVFVRNLVETNSTVHPLSALGWRCISTMLPSAVNKNSSQQIRQAQCMLWWPSP